MPAPIWFKVLADLSYFVTSPIPVRSSSPEPRAHQSLSAPGMAMLGLLLFCNRVGEETTAADNDSGALHTMSSKKARQALFRALKVKPVAISKIDLPQRSIEIYRMRPDLQQAFDLSTSKGRAGLYWWYYLHGFSEMWLDFSPQEDLKGPVNEPVPYLPSRCVIQVTWLMREFWLHGDVSGKVDGRKPWVSAIRRIYPRMREPVSSIQQWRLISWYFCRSVSDNNLEGLVTQEQASALLHRASDKDAVPLILYMVHAFAVDLHDCYPSAADSEWLRWCAGDGQRRFPILAHPLIRDRLFGDMGAPEVQVAEASPFGVNLIGHAGTRSGVGEDLRMAAKALEAAKVPFVVRKVEPSTGVGSEGDELDAWLTDHSPFSINMFCMAGMETVTMLSKRRDLLHGKFNIGFWPWELSEWPQLWSHGPELMDELWASTSFTASAYRRSTSVPVRQVPMAVDVDATEGLSRADFGQSDNRFLFAFSFDAHSSFSRKNPEGVLKAFRMAFPNGDEPVSLILKGLRTSDHPRWCRLESLALDDPRVSFITESMSRGRLLDLYRAIDCFVSLHRSEGFGRNIAECMLLGKAVIATRYSGNVDFTSDATAAMVGASLKPIGDGEYAFGAGQFWADPDLEEAAAHMRRVSSDESWRRKIAGSGRAFIESHYSPAAVGDSFLQELNRITSKSNRGTNSEYL